MSSPRDEFELRDLAVELDRTMLCAGELIENLSENGCSVQLEVWFHGGDESVTLDSLNGEFRVAVMKVENLLGDPPS